MAIGPSISRPGSPVPLARGSRPSAVTSAVMRIGARRSLAPRGVPLDATLRKVADLSLDLLRHEACCGDTRLELSLRELRLLEYLVRAQGRTCTRDELHERVWDYRPGCDPGSKVVQVAIMRLRAGCAGFLRRPDFAVACRLEARAPLYGFAAGSGMRRRM